MLNGAIMDGLTTIHTFGGSIGKANPTQQDLVASLDATAKRVTNYIKDVYEVCSFRPNLVHHAQ
jgi:hypothetical protein